MCKGCKHDHFSTICTMCRDYSLYEIEDEEIIDELLEEKGIPAIDLDNAQREFTEEIKSRTGFTIHLTEQEVDGLIDALDTAIDIEIDSGNNEYAQELIELLKKLKAL